MFSRESLENPKKILRKPFRYFDSQVELSPEVALSNGENPNSIAASVAELFNKQPNVFYFEMDSKRHDIHYSSNTVLSLLVPLLMSPAKPL